MKKLALITLLLTIMFSANAQIRYGVMLKTGYFTEPGNPNTSYLRTTDNLNVTSMNTSGFREIAGTGNILTHKGAYYYYNFNEPRLYKMSINSNGSLNIATTLLFPSASNVPHIVDMLMVDDNTALVISQSVFKIFIVNLTEFKITGEIDLTSLEDRNFEISTPEEMIIRDGKLFVPIWYGSGFANARVKPEAYLAVVDLATRKLEKTLVDTRVHLLGYGGSAVSAIFIDEIGDLYVSGSDVVNGGQGIKPGGILRIKKGQTDFDPTYFVNLDQLCGNRKTIGMTYLGNGLILTTAQYTERLNPVTNPGVDPVFSKYIDAIYKYWIVDLNTKTAQVVETDWTNGGFFNYVTKVGDKFYIPVGGRRSTSGFWELNMQTKTAIKRINTNSIEPFGLFDINQDATLKNRNTTTTSVGKVRELNIQTVLFPIPAQNELSLVITSPERRKGVQLMITDILGRVLLNEQHDLVDETLIHLPVAQLKEGSYRVTLISGNERKSIPFIKAAN